MARIVLKLTSRASHNYNNSGHAKAGEKRVPNLNEVLAGELAVDNYDGTVYTRSQDYNGHEAVVGINAGTVNGFTLERNVYTNDITTPHEIQNLIRACFNYDNTSKTLNITV